MLAALPLSFIPFGKAAREAQAVSFTLIGHAQSPSDCQSYRARRSLPAFLSAVTASSTAAFIELPMITASEANSNYSKTLFGLVLVLKKAHKAALNTHLSLNKLNFNLASHF